MAIEPDATSHINLHALSQNWHDDLQDDLCYGIRDIAFQIHILDFFTASTMDVNNASASTVLLDRGKGEF